MNHTAKRQQDSAPQPNETEQSTNDSSVKRIEEEREQQPYVTLHAVLNAISPHVEVPTALDQHPYIAHEAMLDALAEQAKKARAALKQGNSPPPEVDIDSRSKAFQEPRLDSLRGFIRYSRSARQLHKILATHATELQWYDFAHKSTNIIATNGAREMGLEILASMAGAEHEFMREWEKAESLLRWTPLASVETPILKPPEPSQSELIGFKFVDILNLLDTQNIPYTEPFRSTTFPNWRSDIELYTPANQSLCAEARISERLPDGVSHYPNSNELAIAFASVLGKNRKQWADMFKSPPQWLELTRVQKGRRGMKGGATWNPLKIAEQLFVGVKTGRSKAQSEQTKSRYSEQSVPLGKLDSLFSHHLSPWEKAWHDMRIDLESYAVEHK